MTRQMKTSGVEWIGDIPEKWKIGKLRHLARLKTGNTPSKENGDLYYEGGIFLWIKPEDLNAFSPVLKTKEKLNELGLEFARNVPPYTPLVCCIGSIGKYGVSDQIACFNQQINAVIFNEVFIDKKYGLYYISSQKEQHLFYANGNVVKILNTEGQGNIVFPIPPLSEQKAIADYLDAKCAKIDAFIAKQKTVIEKLKEYKQSVITEAVTKGLNPAAPMKTSGVEWIGDIPEKWNVRKLFQVFTQVKNKNQGMVETNLLSLSYGKIKQKNIETSFGLLPESFETYNIIDKNDIVLRLTDLQNDQKSLRVGLSTQRGIITSAYVTMRAKNPHMAPYLYYLLHTFDIEKGFYGMGDGVRQGLNWDELKHLSFVLPSLSEQKEIADYLDKKCAEIDSLIEKKQQFLTELAIYKKSMIYEYVTGKKEVA